MSIECLTGGGTPPLQEQTPAIGDASQIVGVGFPNPLGAEPRIRMRLT